MKLLGRPMGPLLAVLFVMVAVALALHGLMLVDLGHDVAGDHDGGVLAVCLALLVSGVFLVAGGERGGRPAPLGEEERPHLVRSWRRPAIRSQDIGIATVLRR